MPRYMAPTATWRERVLDVTSLAAGAQAAREAAAAARSGTSSADLGVIGMEEEATAAWAAAAASGLRLGLDAAQHWRAAGSANEPPPHGPPPEWAAPTLPLA